MTPAEYSYYLGIGYLYGINVDRDINLDTALELITKAAEMGYLEAMKRLWVMYRDGNGVKRDQVKAMDWYQYYLAHGGTEKFD